MKWLLLPTLLVLSSGAMAQNVTPQSVVTVYDLGAGRPVENTGPYYGSGRFFMEYDGQITPTMRHQREERARMAIAAFPELEAKLATASPYEARQILVVAEKKARWQRIKATEALRDPG